LNVEKRKATVTHAEFDTIILNT